MSKKFNTELIKVNRLKINLDGGDDKWNAIYVEPYDDKPDLKVEPIIPFDVLDDVVKRADAEGIDVVCHCFGDLATRKLLDAVEKSIAANPERDRRNVISHMMLVHPDDIPRFGKLGVTADMQASWAARDPLMTSITVARLGEERMNRYFDINGLIDTGANISFSSDWPVAGYLSNIAPLNTVQVALTRRVLGDTTTPMLGGEKAAIKLEQALRAHTLGAAYGMGMDKEIGSIEVGKMADLIILEKNLFDVEPKDIGETKVFYTIMNGKVVYQAD